MNPELKQFFTRYSKRIDQSLRIALPSRVPGGERLLEAMSYSLLNGGKRIRPVLTYATVEALQGHIEDPAVEAAACAIECIHAYSLIHDDLPAMDNDDLRRGQATCHIAYDEATAILAGDALQCLGFEILSLCQAPAAKVVQLIRELSRASGANGMVVGQCIDLASENLLISLNQLEQMHVHKTGALIEAAVVMGAIAANAEQSQIKPLRQYAKAIGLAFQVQDDILDVTANTETLGKRQGADTELNKSTYVEHLGLAGAQQKAEELKNKALEALEGFGDSAAPLRQIASYIVERQS